MAYPQPNAQRELANRKILEELQLKKQLLLKQGVASTLNSSAFPTLGSTTVQTPDGHSMNSHQQRAALQTAHAQSMGYFISQDSLFEERLQCIGEFDNPKVTLEQYITPAHLASHMLYTIQSQYGDITGRLVADLGCGCGGLSIGAAVLDASLVVGFEIDGDALKILQQNIEDHEVNNIDAIQCDVRNIPEKFYKHFDTVLINPPFGTKNNEGIDMKFLETAFMLSSNSVYSLHKTSTRNHVVKDAESLGAKGEVLAELRYDLPPGRAIYLTEKNHVIKHAESLGAKGEVLAELRYDLPSTYKFHKKMSVDIQSQNSTNMSTEYSRTHCKIAVAKILQTIGWHSINSTPLEVLTDILANYVQQIAKITKDYSNEFGQTDPNLDHLGLAFQEMSVNLAELQEYVTYVNFVPAAQAAPKFPLPKESNLNFLKPGSKEVVTRPIHINEHLPPMYPLLEEQSEQNTDTTPVKKEVTDEEGSENHQFKKPADVSSPEFKKFKKDEEGGRPTREISSVMMTTSGFLSPAREGKLPEAKAPAPPPEPPKPPSPVPQVPELVPVKKKTEKKKEKIPKELFKPIPEEKVPKKINTMKDILKMRQAKAIAAANAANVNPSVCNLPPGLSPIQHVPRPPFLPHVFPGDVRLPPLVPHSHKPHLVKTSSFNKALAAAKAKTEKLNTTITPIPIKSEPNQFQIPIHHPVDKLVTEPDRKKINILKKISNVKEKHEKPRPQLNLLQQTHDIVSKINLSSDITIEPIIPPGPIHHPNLVKMEPFFNDGSPPGTPPTPRTPEILTRSPELAIKGKRKRKEKPERPPKVPKVKKVKKQPLPHFLDPDILDMTMGRPKTPDPHLILRKNPPFPPLPVHPNPSLPFPFPLANFGGPGLIPPPLGNPLFPFSSPLPDFGKNPYFQPIPPKPEPIPKVSPKPKEIVKPEPAEIVPLPVAAPPVKAAPTPTPSQPPPPPPPSQPIKLEPSPTTSTSIETPKKSKEHKKDKKEKIKKKNKKEKIKDKTEKKKLKEAKKEKDKIKKEKKKKMQVPKEEPQDTVPSIPKILLKVNSPSPRPETPDSMKKLNIKPVIKKEENPERKQREPSPGLAKISALVTGPPKPKNPSPVAPPPEKPAVEVPPPVVTPRPPGRPRIHPIKPKPTPKPKKIEQPFVKMDADGNKVWICPTCGQQDDGRPMIGCDGCDAWYHWVCVGIQVPPDENENWYCKPCLAKKNEDFQDKKKKRKKKEKNH